MTRLVLILLFIVNSICLTMSKPHITESLPKVRQDINLTSETPESSTAAESGVKRTPLEIAYISGIVLILVLTLFSLGCKMDHKLLCKHLRQPVNLIIGVACQFLIMPLIAFSLTKLSQLQWTQALALFACSISPGGGASNMYTEMFEGDVELSVVMTFASSLTAFGTVPLWLLFARQFIFPKEQQDGSSYIPVPYGKITSSLCALVAPLVGGLLLKKYKPEWATTISQKCRYLAVIFLCYVLIVGFIAYGHLFRNLDWKLVVCSITLPWIGFIIGAIFSKVFGRQKKQVIAISLETGLQNTGIAIFLIEQLVKKEAKHAIISPIFYALSTPIPIIICFVLRMSIQKFQNRKAAKKIIREPLDSKSSVATTGKATVCCFNSSDA